MKLRQSDWIVLGAASALNFWLATSAARGVGVLQPRLIAALCSAGPWLPITWIMARSRRGLAPGAALDIEPLANTLAICRLDPTAELPRWAAGPFLVIVRTTDELAIVCEDSRVPLGVRVERGWRALKVAGPLDFSLVGILAALVGPLAVEGVSVFAVSSFDTDYLLVGEEQFGKAVEALRRAGHRVGKDQVNQMGR